MTAEREALWELIGAINWISEAWTEGDLAGAVNYARKLADAIAEQYPADCCPFHDHGGDPSLSCGGDSDAEIAVPCSDGTENHLWVVSDEDENDCYCERCGSREY